MVHTNTIRNRYPNKDCYNRSVMVLSHQDTDCQWRGSSDRCTACTGNSIDARIFVFNYQLFKTDITPEVPCESWIVWMVQWRHYVGTMHTHIATVHVHCSCHPLVMRIYIDRPYANHPYLCSGTADQLSSWGGASIGTYDTCTGYSLLYIDIVWIVYAF